MSGVIFVRVLSMVASVLAAAPAIEAVEPEIATRICTVAVQDRSTVPGATTAAERSLAVALNERSLQPVALQFEPPADVEYAARQKNCSHILYTDIVYTRETAGSRCSRAFRRIFSDARDVEIEAAVEFRLFRLDRVMPLVSTTVTAKRKSRSLSPHVSSRVVDTQSEYVAASNRGVEGPQSTEAAALAEAFKREAFLVYKTIANPNEELTESNP